MIFIAVCDGYKSLHSGAGSVDKNIPEQSVLTNEQQFMLDSLDGAPYFAKVEYLGVRTEALPDDDPEDEFSEALHTFTVRVLDVYRGGSSSLLEFTAISEVGEKFDIPENPVLISLCRNEKGLYWPGVGASFLATEVNMTLVKRHLVNSAPSNANYPLCD